MEKSAVDRPWRRVLLGFTFVGRQYRRRVSDKALKALRWTLKQKTRRTLGVSFRSLIEGLGKTLRGWRSYYGFSEVPNPLRGGGEVDSSPTAVLSLEAVGQTRLPGVEATGSECGPGVEHGEVGPWTLALEPEPGADDRFARQVLPEAGSAEFGERIGRPTESAESPCT